MTTPSKGSKLEAEAELAAAANLKANAWWPTASTSDSPGLLELVRGEAEHVGEGSRKGCGREAQASAQELSERSEAPEWISERVAARDGPLTGVKAAAHDARSTSSFHP